MTSLSLLAGRTVANTAIWAATFTHVNGIISCFFSINFYKIGLPFTPTIACDQRRGLLIAFPKEKYSLKQ